MSFLHKAIVFAGLLFAGLPSSPAADSSLLNSEAVDGLTLAGLSKILEATDLRRLPLRLVLDEKVTPDSPEENAAPVIRHHVLMIEPGSKRLRYDRVDYGRDGNAPYVCSSFTDGVHSGRWESALKPEDVPRLLKGEAGFSQHGGMFYTGPNVCYSADIVLRVMGVTMGGRPMADIVRNLGDDTVITPDNAGDGVLVTTKLKKLTLDSHGLLRQYFMFRSGPEGDSEGGPAIVESILVTESGHVGNVSVPTRMHRRLNYRDISETEEFELRVPDCRVITSLEMIQATNPMISKGTVVVGGKNGLALDEEMRAFGPVESVKDQPIRGK